MRQFLLTVLCIYHLVSVASSKQITAHKRHVGERIIGGAAARPDQFPYAAAITAQTQNSRHFCGGSLLSTQWILTAGQCVDDAILFQIVLGAVSLSTIDSNRLELSTSTYILHPEYDPSTLHHDIGLIEFRLPISFSDYIGPISHLPLSEIPDFVSTSAYGWGQLTDEAAGISNVLHWVVVVTMTNVECRTIYGSQIIDNMLCVEGNYNEGTCNGDTGSSLIQHYNQGYTGYSVPVGISSFISFNGCESTDPSGYTRVFPYANWIRNATKLAI